MAMTDAELEGRAAELRQQAASIRSPLIPGYAVAAIVAAADLVGELVKREVQRNAKGER